MDTTTPPRDRLRIAAESLAIVTLLASCSAGGEDAVRGDDPPAGHTAAARFLTQTTFGVTDESLTRLNFLGYTNWLEEQRRASATLHHPPISQRIRQNLGTNRNHRMEAWWAAALNGPDQLRQRMAFALSQILVISETDSGLSNKPSLVAAYYDILVRNAFGNFRTLLGEVSRSPAMGIYLSSLRNRKADPKRNIQPDENYAREVMQLFTIGLVMQNADGTPKLDSRGDPIPTYDQDDIAELARVFTGWTYADSQSFWSGQISEKPMMAFANYHDAGEKTLLGQTIPAGLTPRECMDRALDLLFAHQNVGPFLAKLLIQRFVTSNPSPGYIARVAAAFADNGSGVRGDLWATLRTLLLDPEAMQGATSDPENFGKLKEPLLRLTQLWRAFKVRSNDGSFRFWSPENAIGQGPLRSPTVFNFFRPEYAPQGEIHAAGLAAPEFAVTTMETLPRTTSQFFNQIFYAYRGRAGNRDHTLQVDLDREFELAETPDQLIDRLDRLLLAGTMSNAMRAELASRLAAITKPNDRALEALWLVTTSPEFAVQR